MYFRGGYIAWVHLQFVSPCMSGEIESESSMATWMQSWSFSLPSAGFICYMVVHMNGHANKKASTQLNTSKTISKNYFSTWTSYANVLSPFCQDHLCWNKRFWLAKHSGLLLSLMKGSGKFPACYRSRSVPLPNFNVTWLVGPLVAGKRQRIFLKRRVFGVWSILVKEKCTRIVIMKTQIQSVRVISLVLALGIRTMSGLVTSLWRSSKGNYCRLRRFIKIRVYLNVQFEEKTLK